MIKLAMPFALHYFYLLGEDTIAAPDKSSSYESAWSELAGRMGLSPSGELPAEQLNGCADVFFKPDCARLAVGGSACLCLYSSGHVAVLALFIKAASGLQALDEVEKQRKALEEKGAFYSLIGESTILESEVGLEADFPAETLSKASLPGAGRPLLVREMEGYRRLYIAEEAAVLKTAGDVLSTVDSLLYQAERQKNYCLEQINTFTDTRDGLERKVAETLFRKGNVPEELEKEIEALSDIYGVMANYNLMLRDAKEQVESDLKGVEKCLPHGAPEGDYFAGKLQELKAFCGGFLSRRQEDFSLSLENARAAIEVVKGRIELARSRENVSLQEHIKDLMRQNVHLQQESLTIGIAASFIEFFIVIYYGLQVWHSLAGDFFFEAIPVTLKGGLATLLSIVVAAGTHRSAKAIKEKNFSGAAAWVAAAAAVIALIAVVTIVSGHEAATREPF